MSKLCKLHKTMGQMLGFTPVELGSPPSYNIPKGQSRAWRCALAVIMGDWIPL